MSVISQHDDFEQALRSGLRECGATDGPIVVGVSGGADSVALLRGLVSLGKPVVAAHLDHGLRSASSRDAEWVAEFAAGLGVPARIERIDVRERAARSKQGIEDCARAVRYEFVTRIAGEAGANFVAVAHTADDQAETILHHVLRGTGIAGLRGIARRRPLAEGIELVRPLLDVSRADVLASLNAVGQEFREDPSNRDPAFTRNRIRHELLPLLERDFNPRVRTALLRLARQAEEVTEFVEREAAALLDRALRENSPEQCRLDADVLRAADDHLLRAALVELWRRRGWRRLGMGFDDWNRVVGILRHGGAVTLPGRIDCRRGGGHLVLVPLHA